MSIRRCGIGFGLLLGLLLLAMFAPSPVQAQGSSPEGLVFDCLTDAGYEVLDVYGDDEAAMVTMEPVSDQWDEDLRTQVVWGWHCLYPNYEESEVLISALEYDDRYYLAYFVDRADFGDWLDGEMDDADFASAYTYGVYDTQIGDWISETDFTHTYFLGAEPTIEEEGLIPRPGQQAGEPVFSDDFSDDNSGLPEVEEDEYEIGYVDGEYHINLLQEGQGKWMWYPDQELDDFAVQVQARRVEGSDEGDYGLIIRAGPGGEEFYNFAISAGGYYNIYKYGSDGWTELVGFAQDSAIVGDGEWDLLRVEAEGPAMSFLVNGEPLATVEDEDFSSGTIGFYAATYEDPEMLVAFDNLTVWTGEAPSEGWSLVLEDDFSDDDSGWPSPLDDTYCEGDYEDGEYQVTATGEDACPVTFPEVYTDFAFEVDARQVEAPEGSMYALLFRAEDTDDPMNMEYAYVFAVSPAAGDYALFGSQGLDEEGTVLQVGESSSFMLDGQANRFRVEAVGENIALYLNGDLLTSVEDSDIAEGRIGFVVWGDIRGSNHVAFDNLKLYVPEGPPTGEPTFGPITWYESIDEDGEAQNPVTEYPRGTTQLIAGWEYENMEDGVEWGYNWLLDGEIWGDWSDDYEWRGGESGEWRANIYYQDGSPLESGEWEVQLYVEGELKQSATARIR
ncbi:MAG TPA: family 16 glycoside hydrolase [Anaerolineae bacterium]|nr:family 16 glycoside hydrolase [Anaerolineae bacterium]